MTKRQRLELEQSEKRQKLNELLALDTLTDEQRTELDGLTKRMQQLEVEIRAAIVAEPDPDPDPDPKPAEGDAKLAELRGKVRLSNYVAAAIETRAIDGAEAEYNQEIGLKPGGAFPLDLLAPAPVDSPLRETRDGAPDLETRATTDTDSQATQKRWLDRLFADTAARRLGVTFEEVEPGVASYPVTTAGASAAQRGRTEAAADAAWTVGVTDLKPSRNAVRAVFSEEDAMRLPTLEQALRRDLSMALAEGVDRAVFLGDDGANENAGDITGLLTAANVVERTITQADKVKADKVLAEFVALVDGKHAGSVEDLRVVLAVGAHTLWATTIANSAAENQTVLQFLKASGLMASVRGEIETATADGDFGAFVGRGRGIEGAGVAAIWNSGMLIRDPYSGAAKGECALTLSYFWNFGLPRPSNFSRVKFAA